MPGAVTGRTARLRALLALVALLSGCGGCDQVPNSAITQCQAEVHIGSAATDILFVIDESGSMAEEQEALRVSLGGFVDELALSPNDFRIGVVTTSVSTWDPSMPGEYTAGPNACPGGGACTVTPYPKGAIVAIERDGTGAAIPGKLWWAPPDQWLGPRFLDHGSATLVPDFEGNVQLGTDGSGKEEPLRAARLALSDRITDGTNAGFLRSGARLAVVILTDEDDCSDSAGNLPPSASAGQAACHDPTTKFDGSLDDLDDLVTFLQGPIAGEARDPIVAVIAGFDLDSLAATGCPTSYDSPTRLDSLLAKIGPDNSFKDSICRADYSDTLDRLANLLVPQTLPLEGELPDPRMLAVSVHKVLGSATCPQGCTVPCPAVLAGSTGADAAPAVYTPGSGSTPATLTFQNECVLEPGDRVDVRIVCAG